MNMLKGLLGQAKDATERACEAVGDASATIAGSLPDAGSLKRGVGCALVVGGKALIDPQRVVGEFAVGLGQMLAEGEAGEDWLVLGAGEVGFEVLHRGGEADARAGVAVAVNEGRCVLLCRVVEAAVPAEQGSLLASGARAAEGNRA
ncbi:hypothetical protein [Ottowia sp.]|uniref:hypothetical protein n=1 Tax=Ottowia sp. TaxID=1898956 RepID=UPI0025D7BCAE|nr:hypothetical protein [Ottowia sp.]MBK6616084.1 hypothetical protein [Ottowia sp.]